MEQSTKLLLSLALVLSMFTCEARDRFRLRANKLHNLAAFANCKSKLCASRVSFCIIMKDCGCDARPGEFCDCCKPCVKCLGNLWSECCECVGLCHVMPNNTANELTHHERSNFGDLEASLPPLFEALSYGSNTPVAFMTRPKKHRFTSPEGGAQYGASNSTVQVQGTGAQDVCKVAFFDSCTTLTDCVHACASMGSHRYRWFHNGCCQCIGERCQDYGELQPLCKSCSSS